MARKKASPKKSNHLSEVLNAVTLKTVCEYKPKEFKAYVLSLFLSEDPHLCKIVNEINPYLFNLTDELIYKYYVAKVPKGKRYIKFTKKTADAKEKEEKIKKLMDAYGLSKREASLHL